jgi:hypothetical protein
MSRLDLALILDDCVQWLRAGEDVTGCLARYPDHAAELTPMVAAAVQLRGLAEVHLSFDAQMRAKATLRRTLAARRAPAAQSRRWPGWLIGGWTWQGARGLAVAAVCIVLIFGALTATTVAASQPGDFSYPLRVAIERAPALFQGASAGRAATELTVADRRLADLQAHFTAVGQADTTALNALLTGDEAAAKVAPNLDPAERERVVSRVVAHAGALAELARIAPEPEVASALQAAAEHAMTIAGRVQSAPPASGSRPPAGPGPSPTPLAATDTPTANPPAAAPETPTATTTPTASVAPTNTPTTGAPPSASATPSATLRASASPTGTATPTATPRAHRPTRTATPMWPRPSRTPEPRPRVTETLWPRTGTPGLPSLPTRTPSPTRPEPRPSRTPLPRLTAIIATLTALPTRPPEGTVSPTWVPPIVATLTARPTRAQEGTVSPTWVPPIVATLTARATSTPDHTPVGPRPTIPRPRPTETGIATPPAPAATASPAPATPEPPTN